MAEEATDEEEEKGAVSFISLRCDITSDEIIQSRGCEGPKFSSNQQEYGNGNAQDPFRPKSRRVELD